MNKFRLLAIAASFLVTLGAHAQQYGAEFSSKSRQTSAGWNTVYLQFNPIYCNIGDKEEDGESDWFTGLSVGYSHAFALSQRIPLYIETGLALQYAYNSLSETASYNGGTNPYRMGLDVKTTLYSIKLPINLMYRWNIPYTKMALMPYVGFALRYNIAGSQKYDFNLNGTDVTDDVLSYLGLDKRKFDLFDSDDMGGSGNAWNRFQVGWNIGLDALLYDHLRLGVSFGTDFNKIARSGTLWTTSITLGYCF